MSNRTLLRPQPQVTLPLDEVLQGDCREILSGLPPKSVDLIFADPPYNLQLRGDLWRPNLTHVDAVDDAWDQFSSFAEYDRFTREWLLACRDVMKDTATLWVIGSYHNIYRVGSILQDLGFWVLNDVVWTKTNPMPQFRGSRFCNAHETLLWVKKNEHQTKYTFNYKSMKAANDDLQMRSDWHIPLCTGDERLKINGEKAHPTQKPEALIHRIIRACTLPGDVVLDPFFGTGTTGAVAKKLRRHFVGIEKEDVYVNLARERIAETVPPLVPDEMLPPPLDAPKRKIAFTLLLEFGLVSHGMTLRLGKAGPTACIMEDGTLVCGDLRGSIHKVAAQVLGKPSCNGWEHWHYQERQTGDYRPIDALREQMRGMMEKSLPPV